MMCSDSEGRERCRRTEGDRARLYHVLEARCLRSALRPRRLDTLCTHWPVRNSHTEILPAAYLNLSDFLLAIQPTPVLVPLSTARG